MPVVNAEMYGRSMNRMAGYCREMDNSVAGDVLTIIPEDRALALDITGGGDKVLGISYEIRSMDRERLVERTRLDDWEETESGDVYKRQLCHSRLVRTQGRDHCSISFLHLWSGQPH